MSDAARFRKRVLLAVMLAGAVFSCGVIAQTSPTSQTPAPGRSEPGFSQPSLPPGVDYTLPTEDEIHATLNRVLEYFQRSTRYEVINVETGEAITDLSQPVKNAGVDISKGEFIDWTYSTGVALAGMLQVSEVTGDKRFREYALRNFDFIFDHEDYFRRQAAQFGAQPRGYRRLLEMRELDDCGAIGAALIKAYALKHDARYRATIDVISDYITKKQMRMPDGTLARPRPMPVSLWVDDLYMSVPFLAQMGNLTGERKYFDDAARQVIQFSDRLFNPANGLWDHAWFEGDGYDPRFYWGRGNGWALMAMTELLSVMPEDHPERGRVLDVYRRAVRGIVETQSGNGMWHELLDRTDSYLETSASAMFTFALARGVNRGWLSPIYAPVAQTGWQAVATHVRPSGETDDICVGTTAAYDATYYYHRPTDVTAMQGYGPVLMAGAEVLTMLRKFDVEKKLNTFHYRPHAERP